MKKFFLKGKQLLSKKLQQFDIEPVQIDYVGEQTPSRLKQSLSILRDGEIDLQDNSDYEAYFKNYPNHHVSHFLLDKYQNSEKEIGKGRQKQKQKQRDEGLGKIEDEYIPPRNDNSYIPPFDQKLQSKALDFKSSIQSYQQGYTPITNPLLCICVVHFHHKRGTEIQYKYPNDKNTQSLSEQIVHHAMPDSSHLRDEDCNFFNFQMEGDGGKKRMMFGVSYFKQIRVTEDMRKNNVEITRSHVQKAIAIIATVPLFQYLKLRLENTTQLFFQNFTDFSIIKQAYLNINQNVAESWPHIQLPDLYMGCNLYKIVTSFGITNLYEIWKALAYQKRVVVFAQTSSDASSFILGLLSLFPGMSAFGVCSRPISRYLQGLREYSLPLRLFSSQNFLSISFHVQDFWQLAKFSKNDQGSFLLGTTNRLLKQSNQYGIQMLVNLQDGTIVKNKPRRPWEPLTKKQKNFISDLKDTLESLQNGSVQKKQDVIRGSFHQFLKSALVMMIQGIRDYQNFVFQCAKYQKSLKKSDKISQQPKRNHSYQLMQDQQQPPNSPPIELPLPDYAPAFPPTTSQLLLPELLLNKSFAYFRQFHNTNLPEIIDGKLLPSIYVNNYEYYFRVNACQFISYDWLDKRLFFGRGVKELCDGKEIRFKVNGNLGICKEGKKDVARSVYIGMIENGRYTKNGFYVDSSQYYEGEFQNGFKHGYGKFSNKFEKYIGNFAHNLYNGEGQLVKDGSVYVGSFRQGLRHGPGSVQGEENYVGEWVDDERYEGQEKDKIGDKMGEYLEPDKQSGKKERKGSSDSKKS